MRPNYWQRRREALGKSQRRIAQQVAVSNTLVSLWEQGECVPPLKNLPELATAYQATEDEIIEQIVRSSKARRERLAIAK